MPRPSAEALRLGAMHRLTLLSEPRRGASGERLARGTGSSLEFQDRRAYQPGDDVRHVDWRALARSDQVLVRQYRAEVVPRVELVLDPSRSMAVEEPKAQVAVDLVALLASAARGGGFECVVALAGDRPELVDGERFQGLGVEFRSRSAWPGTLLAATARLRSGAMRVLISDFLFPHDAAQLVRPLAARSGGLVLIQVLCVADLDPTGGEAARLVDSETEMARDLVLDHRALKRYRERLARLTAGLQEESQRCGARFVRAVAGTSLPALARSLAASGVLELDG